MGLYQYDSTEDKLNLVAGSTNFSDAPVGAIFPFGGTDIPVSFLLCDGSAVSRTDYEDLFNVIGTAFGTGDDSTTFNLPDLRETVPVGSGTRGSGVADHDSYAIGEFKDDQVQDIGKMKAAATTGWTVTAGGVAGYITANSDLRTGDTTHGKQLGVNYIIKAKMVGVPADFANHIENVVKSAITNPNLLDNPWFTVNQRGQSSYIGGVNVFTADRWQIGNNGIASVGVTNNGITITASSGISDSTEVRQRIDNDFASKLDGKILTLSALLNGQIYSATGVYHYDVNETPLDILISEGVNLQIRNIPTLNTRCMVRFLFTNAGNEKTVNVQAVKLELGSVSTLANDVAPNYAEELAKCQRYFQRVSLKENYTQIGFFRAGSATAANGALYFQTPMRIRPSVQANNVSSLSLYVGANTFNVSAISSASRAVYSGDNAIAIELVATSSGLTNGSVGILAGNGSADSVNPSIDISADL